MTTKTKEINPKDLPLTRGQAEELTRGLVNLLALGHSGIDFNDIQWGERLDDLLSIVTRTPPKPVEASQPEWETDEQQAQQRRRIADERSGEKLRPPAV
jgi:hypothetical protein